jgi:hypothetical protein
VTVAAEQTPDRDFAITLLADADSIATRARALSSLRTRAAQLHARSNDIPPPHVPCTAAQYRYVCEDSNLAAVGRRLFDELPAVTGLPFSDESKLGREVRGGLCALLDIADEVLLAAEEHLLFEPPPDRAQMTKLARDFTTRLINAVTDLIFALSAVSEEELRERTAADLLLTSSQLGEIADLIDGLATEDHSLDERLRAVFKLDAEWTNAHGAPVEAAIGFGPAPELAPMETLRERAISFFSHLIDDREALGKEAAMLIPAAHQLAMATSPLPAHSVASATRDMLIHAYGQSPDLTRAQLQRWAEDAQLAYEARRRSTAQIQRLLSGPYELEELATIEITALKRVTEAARADVNLLLDLAATAVRKDRARPAGFVTLGQLADELAALADQRFGWLSAALNIAWRNAEAHEDWRFDSDREVFVRISDPSEQLSLEAADAATELLGSVLDGINAAVVCFSFDSDQDLDVPGWITRGEAPDLVTAMIYGLLSTFGLRASAVELRDDELTVGLAGDGLTSDELLTPAIALRRFARGATITIAAPDSSREVRVDCEAIDRYAAAPEEIKNVAFWWPILSARRHAGLDSDQGLRWACAVLVTTIETIYLPEFLEVAPARKPGALRKLRRRLVAIRDIAASNRHDPEVKKFARALTAAIRECQNAANGDLTAYVRLDQALGAFERFRQKHAGDNNGVAALLDR